jgi:hypothetical protein
MSSPSFIQKSGHHTLRKQTKNVNKKINLPLQSFHQHYGTGVDLVCNRNEYQESSWGKGLSARKAGILTAIYEAI